MIRVSHRFLKVAQRILDGDESKTAAAALEGVLLDEHLGAEEMDDLLLVLSLYAPGNGSEYYDGYKLRIILEESLSNAVLPRQKEQP
ncbi:hypothetical protein DM794_15400 [Paenarthrobacter ureafaciens]|uniref:hypothetical protein n=1 Tax=Paenarthrobacter ureafaciens TaxID=37931 RepID=UPI0015B907E4|nr:hypothetical protein [Paenarthrobacter ureafaciens]NWL28434.1 hypothetical protein [Paenarthrobacter ureafaciens]